MPRSIFAVLVLVSGVGCATVRTADGGTSFVPARLIDQIAFEHGCSADRIVQIRGWELMMDLDVCGRVRRYRCFAGACADVTHAFPPDALPSPVQRASAPPPGPAKPTAAP